MHIVLWRFRARPGLETEFEAAYGEDGLWSRLFLSDAGYLGSELLRATDGTYLTIDRWASAGAYDAFREANAARYAELDAQCQALTSEEKSLGSVEA